MADPVLYAHGWHECRGISAAERHNTVSASALSHVWGGFAYYDCVVSDPDGRELPRVLDEVRRRRNLHRVLLRPEDTGGRLMHLETRYPVGESLANLALDRLSNQVLGPVVNAGSAEEAVVAAPCRDPRHLREALSEGGMDFAVSGDGAAYRAALGSDALFLGYAVRHFGRSFPLVPALAGPQPRVSWDARPCSALAALAARDLARLSPRSARRAEALALVRLVRRGVRECSLLRRGLGMSKAAFSRLAGALEHAGLLHISENRRFACLTPGGARLAAHGPA